MKLRVLCPLSVLLLRGYWITPSLRIHGTRYPRLPQSLTDIMKAPSRSLIIPIPSLSLIEHLNLLGISVCNRTLFQGGPY